MRLVITLNGVDSGRPRPDAAGGKVIPIIDPSPTLLGFRAVGSPKVGIDRRGLLVASGKVLFVIDEDDHPHTNLAVAA